MAVLEKIFKQIWIIIDEDINWIFMTTMTNSGISEELPATIAGKIHWDQDSSSLSKEIELKELQLCDGKELERLPCLTYR